jgi:hypothetical protein
MENGCVLSSSKGPRYIRGEGVHLTPPPRQIGGCGQGEDQGGGHPRLGLRRPLFLPFSLMGFFPVNWPIR